MLVDGPYGLGERGDKIYLWNESEGKFELSTVKAPVLDNSMRTYGYISMNNVIERCAG